MEVDLSLGSLLNAAGSFLFLLAGIAILVLGRFGRRALLLGGTAACFGIAYISENILTYTGDNPLPVWIFTLSTIPGAALAFGLALDALRDVGSRERRLFASVTVIVAVVVVGYNAMSARQGDSLTPWFGIGGSSLRASFVLLALAVVLRVRAGAIDDELAWARVSLAFGLWVAFNVATNLSFFARGVGPLAPWVSLAYVLPLGILALFVPGARERPASRLIFHSLLLAALAGTAFGVLVEHYDEVNTGFGVFGVVRVIGVVLLALAVLRSDILGTPLPRLIARRGALATGALATLFIVAQLAQNFLHARYGLLMGGIVAGAFLFAALPLQRALEGRGEARAGAGRNDDAFRTAVRLAYKDRRFSREEEVALADLAERLGIGARRATEIRHEVEQESGLA